MRTVLIFGCLAIATIASSGQQGGKTRVNIRDYGAKGDGATDDRKAIQAAVNACAPGGTVLVPAGTFVVGGTGDVNTSSGVLLPSEISLVGVGPASILKRGPNERYRAIVANEDWLENAKGNEKITIRNLTFDGNRKGQTIDEFRNNIEFRHCVYLMGARDVSISKVNFVNLAGDGILLGNTVNRIKKQSRSRRVKVTGCSFAANNDNRQGISILDGEDITISGCSFQNLARPDMPGGIDLEPIPGSIGINGLKVVGNTFRGCRMGFVSFRPPTITGEIRNVVVEDNTFVKCGASAVYLWGCENVRVRGNTIDGTGANAITVNDSPDVTIDDNKVLRHIDSAVRIRSSARATISNNDFLGGSASMIRLENSPDGKVLGNSVRRPGGRGIYLKNSPRANLSNNRIYDLPKNYSGVLGEDSDDVTVSGNTFDRGKRAGFGVESKGKSGGWRVSGNRMLNSTDPPASLVGRNAVGP